MTALKEKFNLELAYVVFLSAIMFSLFGKSVFIDPDTGWHIRAGQYILTHWQIPVDDPWTFTADQQWYNISWLFDIVLATLYNTGDTKLLFVLSVVLSTALVSSIFLVLSLYDNIKIDTRYVVTGAVGLVYYDLMNLRPQMFCQLLALVTMVLLHKSKKEEKYLYALPAIIILWVNLHGSFPLLFMLLGLHGIECLIDKNYDRFKTLVKFGCICLLFTLINPLGYKIYIAIFRTLDSVMNQYILEWHPWNFRYFYGLTFIVILTMFAAFFGDSKRVPFTEHFLAFMWLIAAIESMRYFGFYAVFGAPYIALTLDKVIKPSPFTFKLPEFARWVLALAIVAFYPYFKDNLPSHLTVEISHPKAAIEYVARNYPGERVFNDYSLGGYLIYFGNDRFKHYIDGRAGTSFSEAFLDEYIDFAFKRKIAANDLAYKHQFTVAILNKHQVESANLHDLFKSWKVVFNDQNLTVFEKPLED
jgi:hypothetical protein